MKDKLEDLKFSLRLIGINSNEEYKEIPNVTIKRSKQYNKEFKHIPKRKPSKEYEYTNRQKVEIITLQPLRGEFYKYD